ncbi:ferritin family protein [Pontibacter burrus]|uniref:Ferritin-like domain-containing protein n=1 Tax=Pontibacter burrus TaxID=2704466 RepID=A0A6B3LZF2_9BACT|nr:hypothetical protein [Pontibacter burrus]NEM99040.1 hypothetical protein [Pontibacter burrus]
MYHRVADAKEVHAIAKMFRELGEIEQEHVTQMAEKLLQDGINTTVPPPSWRVRTLDRIGKLLGYGFSIGVIMNTDRSIATAQLTQNKKSPPGLLYLLTWMNCSIKEKHLTFNTKNHNT